MNHKYPTLLGFLLGVTVTAGMLLIDNQYVTSGAVIVCGLLGMLWPLKKEEA